MDFTSALNERESELEYLSAIADLYNVVQGKHVVEFACQQCRLLPIYNYYNIASYIGVEPVDVWADGAHERLEQFANFPSTLVKSTYEEFKVEVNPDVVICNGLFYHLHSPFHLIEYLCSTDASTIILETVPVEPQITSTNNIHQLSIDIEEAGKLGNKQSSVKMLDYVIRVPDILVEAVFNQLGYTLKNKQVNNLLVQSKKHIVTFIFEKL